jgi:hypothetical protein
MLHKFSIADVRNAHRIPLELRITRDHRGILHDPVDVGEVKNSFSLILNDRDTTTMSCTKDSAPVDTPTLAPMGLDKLFQLLMVMAG